MDQGDSLLVLERQGLGFLAQPEVDKEDPVFHTNAANDNKHIQRKSGSGGPEQAPGLPW